MKYIQNIVNVKNELIFTIRNCIEKRCGKMKLTSLKNNEKIFRTENIFCLSFICRVHDDFIDYFGRV